MSAAENEDCVAAGAHIDFFVQNVDCIKDCAFCADYHDAKQRSVAIALAVEFKLHLAHCFLPAR